MAWVGRVQSWDCTATKPLLLPAVGVLQESEGFQLLLEVK